VIRTPVKKVILSDANHHLFIFDEETRAMSSGKIKAWLLKLGLFGFLFFLVKGLLWIAVLWFGVSLF
jgi:hypothetical protein